MSRKNRFGCQGNVISPLMQRLWSSRNHFLKSAQNSDLETLKPFALRRVIKSASSLGLHVLAVKMASVADTALNHHSLTHVRLFDTVDGHGDDMLLSDEGVTKENELR